MKALFAICVLAQICTGQSPEPIRYVVRIPQPHTHYVEVEATVPSPEHREIELKMAVWTPYVIREFSKNLEAIAAHDSRGHSLKIEKYRKNRWRIETGGANPVTVAYRVYCHEMSVQDNWVDRDFALLNGAATFLTLAESASRPHEVKLVLPERWKTSITGMSSESTDLYRYRAADYEALVDSPIVAGNPALYKFTVAEKQHVLVNVGEAGLWDGPRSARDVERIVREYARMWGGLPYERYVFLNLLTDSSGGSGMEHSNSTAILTNRSATRSPASYLRWLDLVSHEFFHTWNVKRLKPAEFLRGEYETEPYTKSLGISEGFTSYYGPLAVYRAGLAGDFDLFASLSRLIQQLQTTPGRLVQSLSMSSFDTWIKFYKPDENSTNTAVSYYTKGAVVAFLLDARIRAATADRKSLDDVMRLALARYPLEKGFTPEQFRATAQDVAGADLRGWFVRAFDTTEELDYSEALAWYGLRFSPNQADRGRAWLGLQTRTDQGHLTVSVVPRGTPAYAARFDAGDEILGIGAERIRPEQWDAKLSGHRPGEKIDILIARRNTVMHLDAVLGTEPEDSWHLETDPRATAEQRRHRDSWLHPRQIN
jgi:predicted metalloprotease with PDZ domain